MVDTNFAIYSLDDLVVSPETIKDKKIFRKARMREPYEIIIPAEENEILLRDLKTSPFKKQAEKLVKFYLEADPRADFLSQNQYLSKYLTDHEFVLPWLVPIVRDHKLVYKRKNEGELTVFKDSAELAEIHKNFLNYANIDQSQIIAETLHNYKPYTHHPESVRMTNKSGAHVIRVRHPLELGEEVSRKHLEFRGSYGNWQVTQLFERKKTARKEVITGKSMVDRVIGESLEVIGFARLPLAHPNPHLDPDWFRHAKIEINPAKLETILDSFLPNISQVLDEYQTVGVTDLRVFLKAIGWYGHLPQSLTQTNRKQITDLIMTNLNNIKPDHYERTDRLEYPQMERQLLGERGSGILSDQLLKHEALMEYRIKFDQFPHIYHKYMRMIKKLDNGGIWLSLLNPNNQPVDIKRVVKMYNILNLHKEIMDRLQKSYENMLKDTPPNMALFENLSDNPIDAISDLRPDKKEQIAWFQYFKNAYPDRQEKNYYFRGKWIGCQHEYDSLYQKFEDPDDPYPLGKRYTRLTPHDGVICGFCGDILEEDTHLVDQGYDARGQKVNTYDNDALLRAVTNIDLFLKKDKSEIVRSGEKLVEQWLEISEKRLTKRQLKAMKYEILRVYEDVIMSNKFYQGLQQNPNKIMKGVDRQFGEFVVREYKITDPNSFPTFIFLQKLFQFFYSLSSVYEIIIQRLAVFLVILNWDLAQEDPSFLNPNMILSTWTLEEIGKVFFQYNLSGKSQILSMKGDSKKDEDSFYNFFIDKASKRHPQGEMSVSEYQKFLRDEYHKYRLMYLYTKDELGTIFNGNNPLEHEIMRIYGDYLESLGRHPVRQHLNEIFSKYWNIWKDERPVEVKMIEENARVSQQVNEEMILGRVSSGNRPLFDRSLAQKKFLLLKQLEQIYLDLVNENIYNIRGAQFTDGGAEQIIMKKMFILNKMNCDDWTGIDELGLIGLEEEAQRMNLIIKLREEVSILENQLEAGGIQDKPYLPFTGGELVRDYRHRIYSIYRTRYIPPDLVSRARLEAKKEGTKFKFDFEFIRDEIVPTPGIKIDQDEIPSYTKIFRDLSFLGKINKFINNLGDITYLRDLGIFNKHVYRVINGQMNGTTQCNTVGTVEHPYPEPNEFNTMYTETTNRQYMNSKMQLVNLKKYIISYVRQHIYLMSRITERKQMVQHGLRKYLHLFEYEDFNRAFENFNIEEDEELGQIYSNEEIERLVIQTIPDYAKHDNVVQFLQSVFLTDLVRHLRQVRTRAGKFVRGKKRRKGDEPNAAEIFTEFVEILIKEVASQEKVSNVNFNHLKINQMFMSRMMWNKMEKAEKKSELEWKIMKHNLNIQEFEEVIDASGNVPPEDPTAVDEWDDGALDMENEEDDYDDKDFANL